MTTGARTEGLRGIGSNGFIRTVGNLTVTGDLVVLGENRALAGTGSFFWEEADSNAEYWAFELPSGTSEHVPVLGVGVGLDGVDLGLFDGITQPTMAVIDADRDSFIALDFSGDDAARLRANAAMTISTSSAALTLTPTTDVHVSNGTGLVIGHTAQITANTLAELQILGSAAVDSSAIIGAFSADTTPAELQFVKSRHADVAGNTIVADNDLIGRLNFLPADGVDFATSAATFSAEVEDGSPAAGDIGVAFVFSTMAGGGASLTEKLRMEADGGLKFNQASLISTSTGSLTITPAGGINLNKSCTFMLGGTLQGHLNCEDDNQHRFGNSNDYYMLYNNSGTQFQFIATSGGTILDIQDGTNDVGFIGGISTDDEAAPTAGIATTVIKIGGSAAHGTTAGTNFLSIFDGTAPVGTLANGISLYSTSGELYAIDAAGNTTLNSPHDSDGNWIFKSKNTNTGRVLRVHMEKLMQRLDEMLGGGFVEEFIEEV